MTIKKWLITMAGLTMGLAAITGGSYALASNENDNVLPDIANEWDLVEASGWTSGFSLRLPQEWQLHELQGIDSYVGEIVWDGGRLNFDFGWYSSSLAGDDDPHYVVTYEEIGGRRAKLVRPGIEGDGLITGVYFEDFENDKLDLLSQNRLQISGVGLTRDQQETAFTVFRTIRALAPNSQGAQYEGFSVSDDSELPMPPCCKKPSPSEGDTGNQLSETDSKPNFPAIALGELTGSQCNGGSEAVYVTSDGESGCLDSDDIEDSGGNTETGPPPEPPTIKPTQ